MNTRELVAESNRIEGITREPTFAEMSEFDRFMGLDELTVTDIGDFVKVYQPDAKLRNRPGLDVYVGQHVPPPGGVDIPGRLQDILDFANDGSRSAWDVHCQYETLHPFTDGNGRSGRMVWHWMHRSFSRARQYGFLHWFYYETLRNYKGRR
jgi:hypothetical protein